MVGLVLMCIPLAWISTVRYRGSMQQESVRFLNEHGCWVPPSYRVETTPSPTQPGKYIQISHPGAADPEPFALEFLFGRPAYLEHSDVVIEAPCELTVDELSNHLRNLRGLRHVFYLPSVLNKNEVAELKRKLPRVTIVSTNTMTNR